LIASHLKVNSFEKKKHVYHAETYKVKDLKCAFVDFAPSIRNDADHDFLPSFGTPHLGAVPSAKVGNILDDTVAQQYINKR
jgi:hypothetical protein